MDDERAERALAGRLLEFVGPPAVIRHGLCGEELGICRWRLVHDDQDHLALHVHALEIVPTKLRCVDAVAREHDGRIDVDGVGLRLVADHVIGAEHQIFG